MKQIILERHTYLCIWLGLFASLSVEGTVPIDFIIKSFIDPLAKNGHAPPLPTMTCQKILLILMNVCGLCTILKLDALDSNPSNPLLREVFKTGPKNIFGKFTYVYGLPAEDSVL